MSQFQLHLNSATANYLENNNKSSCVFNVPLLDINSDYEILLSVVHAVIPVPWYNINSSNNLLVINSGGFVYSFCVPVGNYNAITLATTLNSIVLSNDSKLSFFNCTYNGSQTAKFTFTNSRIFNFDRTSTILGVLGFPSSATTDWGTLTTTTPRATYTLISSQCINLIPHQCVCIQCYNIDSNNIHYGLGINNHSVIVSIPITCQSLGLLTYHGNSFKINSETNFIPQLHLRLIDQNGSLIDLNGLDWSITLQFDLEPK